MNKLVWKYFLEQKRDEIKDWFIDRQVHWWILGICGVIVCVTVIGRIAVMLGFVLDLALSIGFWYYLISGLVILGMGVCIFATLLVCYLVILHIYRFIKWIRSNWQEAKRKANAKSNS